MTRFAQPPLTSKQAYERMMTIQRQNEKRHEKATKNSKLRMEIQRNTANRNRQMELDSLMAASLRHSGLDVPALNRMKMLQKKVVK